VAIERIGIAGRRPIGRAIAGNFMCLAFSIYVRDDSRITSVGWALLPDERVGQECPTYIQDQELVFESSLSKQFYCAITPPAEIKFSAAKTGILGLI